MKQLLRLLIQVRHRIDGLEKWQQIIYDRRSVRHRIDGLENFDIIVVMRQFVRHRIDGLENVMCKS